MKWQVFDDDNKIEIIFCMSEEFADTTIDKDSADLEFVPPDLLNHIGGREIL